MKNNIVFGIFLFLMAICVGCGSTPASEPTAEISHESSIEEVESETKQVEAKEESTDPEPEVEETIIDEEEITEDTEEPEEILFGYITIDHPEKEAIVKELEDSLALDEFSQEIIADCIVDDLDGDGELEGIAVTTPEFNREWVESGDYDELNPATLWGYEKSNGEYMWFSKPFYEDNDNEFVRMQEARIKPGIIVLQVDYFKSAHDVRSYIYTFGEEENTACLGTFDNAFINEDGQIVSDHSGYEYDPTEKTLKSVDVIIKSQTE